MGRDEATRHCNRCGLDKPQAEWHASQWARSGGWCIQCYRDWHRARYAPKSGADDSPRNCETCGESYRPAGRRPSIFCSRACKDADGLARKRAEREASKPAGRRCPHCGEQLPQSMRADAVFCSQRCNEAAHALQRKLRARTGDIGTAGIVADGLQRCGRCKRDLPATAFTSSRRWQGAECTECRAAIHAGMATPSAPHPPRPCRACGESYIPKIIRVRSLGVCSRRCADLLRKLAANADKNLRHPDPMCASLDHVIPVSEGGTSDPRNLRLTHLRCNLIRRNAGGGEQLAML